MPSEQRLDSATLPINLFAQEIVQRIARDGRLALVAETGSGKTTQLPQILLNSGICGHDRIVVLQPRRLAARAVARRVAHEMGAQLGGLVGYRTRYERVESAETRILFMTDGLFVRLAQGTTGLDGISTVVLDEFHERGIASDLAAGMVRRFQRGGRGDLRMVVMSATLDATRLAEVFEVEPLTVPGRIFPVEIKYCGDSKAGEDFVERAATITAEAARSLAGDGLVFMPGRREIQWTLEALQARLPAGEFDLLALHGGQQPSDQDRSLNPSSRRKIVVATNVAETSLTIPGIRFVVDAGLARVHRFDPLRDLNALKLEPISQSSARQRAGRAGRTAPGNCYRLWSEQAHARRNEFDTPEVHRIDLSEALLSLAVIGEVDPMQFPWIDAPTPAALDRAQRVLAACGAFEAGGRLTADGRAMARIPAHPRLARALLEGARRGVAVRAGLWAALLSERDPFDRESSEGLRRALMVDDRPGDLVARERLFTAWRGGRGRGSSVDSDAADEISRASKQLADAAVRAADGRAPHTRAPDPTSEQSDAAIAESFALGFPDRIAWRLDRNRPHAALAGRRKVAIDKRSIHAGEGPLLALEVRQSGSGDKTETTLSMTVALERDWLESIIPNRFTTRIAERWEESSQSVEEVEEKLFDETVIARTVRPPRNIQAAADVIANQMIASELRPDDWQEQALPWIARAQWVAAQFPERQLLAYCEDDLRILFAEIVGGCTRWSQARTRPSLAVVIGALGWEDRQFVEQMAPAELRLPGGFRLKLAYQAGQPPAGRAKIQDLFGLDETPRVAGSRAVIRLEILGPNRRPLQVTSDLAGFWRVLYPDLRNELRRRYPRHEWR